MMTEEPLEEAERAIADFYHTPFGQEVTAAASQAFLDRQAAILQQELDEMVASLPWPMRFLIRLQSLWIRITKYATRLRHAFRI